VTALARSSGKADVLVVLDQDEPRVRGDGVPDEFRDLRLERSSQTMHTQFWTVWACSDRTCFRKRSGDGS
jgi:hypothetical protein